MIDADQMQLSIIVLILMSRPISSLINSKGQAFLNSLIKIYYFATSIDSIMIQASKNDPLINQTFYQSRAWKLYDFTTINYSYFVQLSRFVALTL